MSKQVAAKSLITKAIAFFDIVANSKVDLTTEGTQTVYRDPLGNLVQPRPTEIGNNRYDVHGANDVFRQEIHFQNGSPAQGLNGISNEALMGVLVHRLTRQNEMFPSAYNVLTIQLLQGAMSALHSRVKDRADFGITNTAMVEPTDKDDAHIAKALAVVNSLGILGDILVKFDAAYALATPGRIQEYVEDLAKRSQGEANDLSIVSAFSLSSVAVMGSGVFRGFAAIGSEMLKTIKGEADDQNHSANDTAGSI